MSEHKCPSCGHKNKGSKGAAISCPHCKHIYWPKFHPTGEGLIMVRRVPVFKVQIPDIDVDSTIFVVNSQHPKHLEPGRVIRKAHGYYQIEFNDKMQIWMPSYWIEKSPW
jgi:DNA-directed RNA polymerase subunit RPC12/RpoP